MINFLFLYTFCDRPYNGQFGLQDPATEPAIGMISFHYYLCMVILIIGIAVFYILLNILWNFTVNIGERKFDYSKVQKFSHSSSLEIIWTILPAIILVFLAVPSFNLLYSLDEIINPSLTVKIIGHQWYWSYEYGDVATYTRKPHSSVVFNAYLLKEPYLREESDLLETDMRLVLPVRTHIRLLVSSADVLHSWAVPSFGVKIDACPGRLSQVSVFVKREGWFYGQCSEICGINHGFMPIQVLVLSRKSWLENFKYPDICRSEAADPRNSLANRPRAENY